MPEETGSEDVCERLQEVEEMMTAGQYAAAGVVCEELVNTHPDSAAAHAALAETYAARQMWQEAMDWYELAAQLGAGTEVTRHLEKARRRLAAHAAEAPGEPPGEQVRRERARLGWIFGGAAGAVLLAIVIALSGLFSPSPRTPSPSEEHFVGGRYRPVRSSESPPTVPPARPRPTYLRPAPREITRSTSPPAAAAPTGSRPPIIITRAMMGPVSDRDYHIARALGSLSWDDGAPMTNDVAVAMDPFTGYAMISFEIPRALQVDQLFAAVVQQCYSLATTALRTDAGIQWLTLRALGTVTTPDKEERTVVVFRTNTHRGTIEEWMKLRAEATVQELLTEVFAENWWHPAVSKKRLE